MTELPSGWCERVTPAATTYECERDNLVVRQVAGKWVAFRHGRPLADGSTTPEEAMRIGGDYGKR